MDSTITLTNQTNLFLSGVDNVISVCPKEVVLTLSGQKLCVLGENMEIQRLDLENKVLIIDGFVTLIKYQVKKQSLIKRMFK